MKGSEYFHSTVRDKWIVYQDDEIWVAYPFNREYSVVPMERIVGCGKTVEEAIQDYNKLLKS